MPGTKGRNEMHLHVKQFKEKIYLKCRAPVEKHKNSCVVIRCVTLGNYLTFLCFDFLIS